MDSATLIRTAKLIALPLPFALAGYSYAFSQNAVPLIYDAPAHVATPVFKGVYYRGAATVLPGSVAAASAAAYLAYALPAQRNIWAIAAAFTLSAPVYTGLIMKAGINRLLEIDGSKAMQEKATATLEHRQLLVKWVGQNYIRAALWLAAGLTALRAEYM